MKESIRKYLSGKASYVELQLLLKWLRQDGRLSDFKDFRDEWMQERMNTSMDDKEVITWLKIKRSMDFSTELSKQRKLRFYYQIAAIFLLLISVTVFIYKTAEPEHLISKMMTEKAQISRLLLPDSTVIWLNSSSVITYDNTYGIDNRNIHLEGEAFFQVKKNKALPFHVLTGNHDIKVTGTRFQVSNYVLLNSVDVVLEEGSVNVFNKADHTLAKLAPDQKYSFDKLTGLTTINEVVPENYTSWRNGVINFYQLPLDVISQKLELKYNQPFVLTNKIKNKHFTFTIVDENLSEVLSIIEEISNIKATQANDTIYLR